MANQSTILIELKVDDKGSATIKQFGTDAEKSLNGVETSADKTGGASDRLKESWTDLAVKGAAAWMAVTKAMAYMDEGAKALQVESSFKIMAEASGAMAETMIANMKAATRETIDDSDLMQKAIKLLTLGYSTAEIERFSGVIITASQIAGTTAVEAYDRLSDAIANRMPKALVAMGAVTKDQMKVVTDALASGATQSDLLELALSNLELKQKMLAGTSDEAAVSMQKFHAIIGETKETIGKGLIIAADALFRSFQFLAAKVLDVVASYYQFKTAAYELIGADKLAAESRANWNAAVEASNDLMGKSGKAIFDNSAAGQKASAQEIADGKVKVAYAEARLKFIATEGMSEAEAAAAAKKRIEDVAKAREKAFEEAKKNDIEGAELVGKLSLETIKQTDEQMEWFVKDEKKKQEALEKTMESWREAGKTAVGEMEKEIARGVDLTKATLDRLEKRGEAEREIYKDLRGYEDQFYAASAGLIAVQAQKYKDLGVSEVAVAAWVAAETEKNDLKKAKSGDDFMAGIKAGYIEMQNNAMTFGKAGYEIFNTFSTESKKAVSDILFDGIKDGSIDTQKVWTSFTDTMLRKFTDIMGQMVVDAAANAISMLFKAVVSGDWTAILGLIDKAWSLANTIDWGTGNYSGGLIPGYASGGDSPANDTVRAWLSPQEYVEPRTAVNPETIGMLEYIRQNKTLPRGYFEGGYIPGYADGGLVQPVDTWTGMLGDYRSPHKPTSRLDEGYFLLNGSTDDNGFSNIYGWSLYDGTNGRAGQHYLDKQEAETGVCGPKFPVIDEQITENLKRIYYYDGTTSESQISTGTSWWDDFVERYGAQITTALAAAAITYGVGSAVGAAYGPWAGAAAGGGAGGVTGYISSGGNEWSAVIGAIGGAIGGYYAAGTSDVGEILGDMAGSAEWNKIIGAGGTLAEAGAGYDVAFKAAMLSQGLDTVLNFAEKYASKYLQKWAIGEVMNVFGDAMGGGAKGSASLSLAGGSGDLSWLSDAIGQLAPQESSFSFPLVSAQNGLDYVPRDNFRINAHEGEAVLNKKDAKEWRGGSARGGVNFTWTGNIIGANKSPEQLAREIVRPLKEELRRLEGMTG